ncbi:zinc finger protein 670-like [Eupeodes corollae]|uniref:zinc finger protein 670-like n=1 Tax=Eupeodes corollae TaxID=290404 RepID=UPI0024915480|nr:zinc finger protein 670-like [Eupeodes corollae]
MAKEVSKTCRTCLGCNLELLSIYNGHDKTVVKMLEYILDTQLEVSDELPQKVCHECFNDIGRCYSFKTKCIKSFKILRNQLDKRKTFAQVMQIKVEPEVVNSNELIDSLNASQKTLDSSYHGLSTMEMGSIKIEANVCQEDEIRTQQLHSYEKETPSTPTIAPSSNNHVDDSHCENFQEQDNSTNVHTVQYLIRELQEERDSTDQVFEVEVNIRHCPYCAAGFGRKSDFSKHLKKCKRRNGIEEEEDTNQKDNVKRHICPICKKAFPRPCRLKNHLEKQHAGKLKQEAKSSRKYKCPHCDLGFNLEYYFKDHLRSHTNERQSNHTLHGEENSQKRKKHKCKECLKEFEMFSQLNIHILLDHKAKNHYFCKLCQRQFKREHDFKSHSILVHNDDKPFKCKFCATGFNGKNNLVSHEQTCIL